MRVSGFVRATVLWLPLLGILLVVSSRAFPVYDDGYLVLLLRDGGLNRIADAHLDRPVYGALLALLARVGGTSPYVYVLVSALLWLGLALEAALLWHRLFPALPDASAVVGALCLAPIFVQTQLTTVTVALTAGLAIDLSLAGLLVILRDGPESPPVLRTVWTAALTLAGALVSEYGVFAAAAGIALLLVLRRARTAAVIAVPAAVGYGIFRLLGNLGSRPEVDPLVSGSAGLRTLFGRLLEEITGAWVGSCGAVVQALSSVRVETGSRSTLLGAALGGGMAAFVLLTKTRGEEKDGNEREARTLWALLVAVAVGVLPAVLLGRAADAMGFMSRLRMPALGFGAVFVTGLASEAVVSRWRPAAYAGLAFLAGYQSVVVGAEVLRTQSLLGELGGRLRPRVENSEGLTVVVLDGTGLQLDRSMILKVTKGWPPELAQRVWLIPPKTASETFGPAVACRLPSIVTLDRGIRFPALKGPLGALLRVEVRDGQPGELVSYCRGGT